MMGVLFAGGRRVVASWIRAAGLSGDFQDYYFFLQSVGERLRNLGQRLLVLVLLGAIDTHKRVLVAIDDTHPPTLTQPVTFPARFRSPFDSNRPDCQ
jgi:hypothetical protein